VYQPEYYASAEFGPSHHHFIDECLADLEHAVHERGGRITYRYGAMPDVLELLSRDITIESIYSHEETGNAITYARDRRVRAWCDARGLSWHEYAQTGVVRRLRSRDGWAGDSRPSPTNRASSSSATISRRRGLRRSIRRAGFCSTKAIILLECPSRCSKTRYWVATNVISRCFLEHDASGYLGGLRSAEPEHF
jgi:hypothetical protein